MVKDRERYNAWDYLMGGDIGWSTVSHIMEIRRPNRARTPEGNRQAVVEHMVESAVRQAIQDSDSVVFMMGDE